MKPDSVLVFAEMYHKYMVSIYRILLHGVCILCCVNCNYCHSLIQLAMATEDAGGFLDLQRLQREAVQVVSYPITLLPQPRQQVFPTVRFTCDADITRWTVLAQSWPDLGRATELQVWKRNDSETFNKVASVSISADSVLCDGILCRYSQTGPPLRVRGGCVFGLHQPVGSNNSLRVYHQVGGGPVSHLIPHLEGPSSFIDAMEEAVVNSTDFPLVAVTTGISI